LKITNLKLLKSQYILTFSHSRILAFSH